MSSFVSPVLPPGTNRGRENRLPPIPRRSRGLWSGDEDELHGGWAVHPMPLSIVSPVWNEEGNLPALYEAINAAVRPLDIAYELVFVDNGSTDGSLGLLRRLAASDHHVRYVSLSRNFGYQGGLIAGLAASQGQAVVTMDADLQHPPRLIPQMLQLWREGISVVYGRKRNYRLPPVTRLQVRVFYWLLDRLSGLTLSFGQSDFRMLDRRVVDEILRIPESHRFLRGFVDWVGFTQAAVDYDVPPRHVGSSKFTYCDLLGLALDGIVTFSRWPLRWILGLGVVAAAASGVALAVTGVLDLLHFAPEGVRSGRTLLVIAMVLFGSIQTIALGLLGEYIARIHAHQQARPAFIVRETSEAPC